MQTTAAPDTRVPATGQPARRGTWRTDIQGLRAIAVGFVVLAHAGVPRLDGGFIGVDVFFVISGYLITGLLLREHERTGRISIADFYVRRARRILPAATVVILAVLAAAAALLPTTQVEQTTSDARWSAVFLANAHLAAQGTDYFSSSEPSLLQHYWSLAVEEQFYIVWPLLAMLVLTRLSRRAFTIAAAAVFAGSLAWSLLYTASSPAAAYFNTPARAYELAAGALLACVLPATLRAPWRALTSLLGAILIAVAAVAFDAGSAFPGWQALVPTIGTVLLLASGPRCLVGRLLSLRPLRWIGDVSFSLYLWHWPAILLVPAILPDGTPPLASGALAVGVAVALSAVSYHLVEVPFHHRRIPFISQGRRALALWPASVAVVLVGALAATALADYRDQAADRAAAAWFESGETSGFTQLGGTPDVAWELETALRLADEGAPIPPSIDGSALTKDNWGAVGEGCFATDSQTSAPECVFGDENADRVIALVGDSHAAMWLPAFDEIGRERGYQVRMFAKLACAHYPVYQAAKAMTQEECDAFRSWTSAELTELRPDTIFTTARGMLFLQDGRGGVSARDQWSAAVEASVAELAGVTDDIRVLGDVPTRPGPAECLTAPGATQASCISAPGGLEYDSNALTKAAVEAADVGAEYIDVVGYACLDGRCPLVIDEYPVYEDDSHLSTPWVRHIAPRVADDWGL
ncbi:acyltransferase family protein [Microbacterium sp. KNMS]